MPMHDQVLAFFGFSRLPFGKHLKPADIFPSETHQEALSRLSFGVADEDLLLLTGPIGCGKSVALAAFVAALDTNRYTPLYVRGSGPRSVVRLAARECLCRSRCRTRWSRCRTCRCHRLELVGAADGSDDVVDTAHGLAADTLLTVTKIAGPQG